jgi:hypothetical protein
MTVTVATLGVIMMAILLQLAASAPDVLEYVERRNAERLQREKEEFYKTHAFSFAK